MIPPTGTALLDWRRTITTKFANPKNVSVRLGPRRVDRTGTFCRRKLVKKTIYFLVFLEWQGNFFSLEKFIEKEDLFSDLSRFFFSLLFSLLFSSGIFGSS
ncbi:hypothetical protein GYMLUDRAFT_338752 [Collybiopsis luxurians FD-317 M1]|nr:hypothetical protein GYMLUDRAFT_338752 [Collybiopsis luxurians FD-317 M1]